MGEQYTPGHSTNATAFMAARSFGSHGEFIRPYLVAGMKVLDCGCGPGAISVGLAEAVGPAGHVIGVDFGESQIEVAKARARPNLTFRVASVYELPFENSTFAQLGHLSLHHVRTSMGERYRGEGVTDLKHPTEEKRRQFDRR